MLDELNDTYGPIILEELLKRIEDTISNFNEEMSNVFSLLKEKEIERKKAYDEIKNRLELDKSDKNAWEMKVENLKSPKK